MRKDYASELTKEELIKAGVYAVDFENCKVYGRDREFIPTINNQGYLMIALYDLDDNGEKIKIPIKRQFKGCKKPTYTYTYKTRLISLNRLLWAWKYGKVKSGYVIDHVNNKHENLEDYKLENLQEITPAQNLAKERKESDLMVKPAKNKTIDHYLIKLDYFAKLYERAKKDHDAELAHKLRSNISQTRARISGSKNTGSKATNKRERIDREAINNETMNNMYRRITSIDWRKEAIKIRLQNDEMVELIKNTRATRKLARTKTKRAEFDELHYGLDKHGDYCELYMYKDGKYYIYSNNVMDSNKNIDDNVKRPDIIFEDKFRELNDITLRRAFGFVDKTLKRCIPKQFYYINDRFTNKRLKVSSIDASSQYPSGCLGLLPDMHTAIRVKGRAAPSEEYRFAFYASGHCAEYGVFDTHSWLASRYAFNLFRLDPNDEYRLRTIPDEDEETILMKASEYTMDSTWNYFYDIKNSCEKDTEEYKTAKLIMNKTIGCWHRKDKDKTRSMPYDNHGSYQLAHIVAVAIARGNQKILNMIEKIGEFFVIHVCVDGIIYLGDRKFGIDESKLGVFSQEFIDADFEMAGINVYCAKQNGKCVKFKHGGFDLLDGKEIDEDRDFDFGDLYKLSSKEHVGDILWEEN